MKLLEYYFENKYFLLGYFLIGLLKTLSQMNYMRGGYFLPNTLFLCKNVI